MLPGKGGSLQRQTLVLSHPQENPKNSPHNSQEQAPKMLNHLGACPGQCWKGQACPIKEELLNHRAWDWLILVHLSVTPCPLLPGPASQNYTLGNYVRISLACVVLLILVAIVAEAVYSWHRWTQRPQE